MQAPGRSISSMTADYWILKAVPQSPCSGACLSGNWSQSLWKRSHFIPVIRSGYYLLSAPLKYKTAQSFMKQCRKVHKLSRRKISPASVVDLPGLFRKLMISWAAQRLLQALSKNLFSLASKPYFQESPDVAQISIQSREPVFSECRKRTAHGNRRLKRRSVHFNIVEVEKTNRVSSAPRLSCITQVI